MTDDSKRKGIDEMEDEPDKTDESGIELRASNDIRPILEPKRVRKKEVGFIPIPISKRLDPNVKVQEQFVFTWKINLILAGAATVSVSNLYYSQPMLVAIANDFGVSNEDVALIPTLAQAGYATGIVFISPLGDLVRRRPLVILLVLMCSLLSIGLALAKSVAMLQGLTFLIGVTTVTPQICIPWSADLAPSNIRARAMSTTLSGLIVGVVQGRLLAGIFATYASWRDTYWFAVGIQGAMVGGLWLALPDTPDKDIGLSYPGVLWSMVKMFPKYPTLVQVCCCAFFNAMCFAGFWTTTTFLLSSPIYGYSPFNIGLFGLLGLIGALLAPVWGRVVDRIVPWLGQITGSTLCLTSMSIALAAADINIAGVAIPMALYDCGGQLFQVSSSYRVAGLDAKARARLNGCVLLSMFIGQTAGTAILTKIYNDKGWKPTGGTAVGFACAPILFLLLRGPHEERWFGWRGGWELLKRPVMTDLSPEALTEGPLRGKAKGKHAPSSDALDIEAVGERGATDATSVGVRT